MRFIQTKDFSIHDIILVDGEYYFLVLQPVYSNLEFKLRLSTWCWIPAAMGKYTT